MAKLGKSYAFLRDTFKVEDEIVRHQVGSFPALYRLMKLGLVEYHNVGPTRDLDTYRITKMGRDVLSAMHGDQ